MEPHVPEIATVIQLAVAPVFLLTAIGTLIMALNARLGRAVDRRRLLEQALAERAVADAESARAELAQIGRRIRCTYRAILFAVLAALFVCLMIAGAFAGAFVASDLTRPIAALFVLAMFALVASLVFFLREVFLAVNTPRHVPRPHG